MKTLTYVLIVFALCFKESFQASRPLNDCSALVINDDLKDEKTTQLYAKETLAKIWSKPVHKPETALLKQFRQVLLKMGTSDSYYFIRLVSKFTAFIMGSIKHMNDFYPSYCIFAEAINKSVEWTKSGNSSKQIEPKRLHKQVVTYVLSGLKYSILENICCKEDIPHAVISSKKCHDNGFNVNIKKVFDYYGILIPHAMYMVLCQLHNSSIFSERATALVFLYIITPNVAEDKSMWLNGNLVSLLQLNSFYAQDVPSNKTKECKCRDVVEGLASDVETIIHNQMDNDIKVIQDACA